MVNIRMLARVVRGCMELSELSVDEVKMFCTELSVFLKNQDMNLVQKLIEYIKKYE